MLRGRENIQKKILERRSATLRNNIRAKINNLIKQGVGAGVAWYDLSSYIAGLGKEFIGILEEELVRAGNYFANFNI